VRAALDPARRLALGQWYTPPEVADLALALALPGLGGDRARLRVLDLACGAGVFLARAAAAGVGEGGLFGIELDAAAAAAAVVAAPGADVRCADLFSLPADQIDAAGFDAVVGNPPYVRQERLSATRKREVERRLAADWPDLAAADRRRLVGRGDLAVSVVARALRLCRPGGRVALVVSSALLDAGYAAALWRLVERHGRLVSLVDAPTERWFADAAVNAVIAVLERAGSASPDSAATRPATGDRRPTSTTRCRSPVAGFPSPDSCYAALPAAAKDEARDPRTVASCQAPVVLGSPTVSIARLRVATAAAARSVRGPADLHAVAELRCAPAGSPRAWAEALRAPAAWFELIRAAGDRLLPLEQMATVRRGVTSGANDLFYLSRDRAAQLGLEPDLLAPLLRSPREPGSETIAIDPTALPTLVLLAPADEAELAGFPAARRYVVEHADAAGRATLRARSPWWALPGRTARLFLTKAYAGRFVQRVSPSPIVADQRMYSVHPHPGVDLELLAAVLNSTFTALALESLGRASLGEGALEWTVADAARLPILDPRRVDAQARGALAAMSQRPIGAALAERAAADRAQLDRAVGGPLADLLPAIHDALCTSVSRRATRANNR